MSDLFKPKGGDTKTTTTTQTAPQYITQAGLNLTNSGWGALGEYITQPAYTTAGVNADQSGAYDLTRGLAQGAWMGKPITVPGNTNTPMDPAASYWGAASANTTNANAAQVNGADIQKLMNPYIQGVIDPAVANLRQQSNINAAQIGAQQAASASFGGSRGALQQAQNTRALGEQTSQLVSQLMSAGYDRATATALSNAQMQQQANLQNASAANAASQFNANSSNTANSANAQAKNSRDQFIASLGLQNRQQDLSAAQIQDALASSDQTRKLQAINALLGIGNQQQQLAQSNLNVPLQYLQLLGQLTPKDTSGTAVQVAPNAAASPFQNILGGGLSLLGLKTNGGGTIGGNLLNGLF